MRVAVLRLPMLKDGYSHDMLRSAKRDEVMTWKCVRSGCGATLPGLSERIISFDEFAAMKARIATLEAALDECYEAGRPPTSDELDRLKVPTAPETEAAHIHNFHPVMRASVHQPGMFAEQACDCGVELCFLPKAETEGK